jgi:hypothetical protein
MWRPGPLRHAVQAVPPSAIVLACVSAAVGAAVGSIMDQSWASEPAPPPSEEPSLSGTASPGLWILIIGLVGTALFVGTLFGYRRIDWRVLVVVWGLFVGFVLATSVVVFA